MNKHEEFLFLKDLHNVFKKHGIKNVYIDNWTDDIVFNTGWPPDGATIRLRGYVSSAYRTSFAGVLNENIEKPIRRECIMEKEGQEPKKKTKVKYDYLKEEK